MELRALGRSKTSKTIKALGKISAALVVASGLGACSDRSDQTAIHKQVEKTAAVPASNGAVASKARLNPDHSNRDRKAYFGDLHVHTEYSSDAYAFGTLATPYDAYRYAEGEAIKHPAGFDMQLERPLDFYAVTDHGSALGLTRAAADTTTEFSRFPAVKQVHNLNAPQNMGLDSLPARSAAFRPFLGQLRKAIASGEIPQSAVQAVTSRAWADIVKAADVHYRPGTFTTFAAYEYTAAKRPGSLHRNVIFRSIENIPGSIYHAGISNNPEDLWTWMDARRDEGIEILAIPHNSNGSSGQMFELASWAGNPMSAAYSAKRSRNEPLVEITQAKGTSETHPMLSSRDEWAGFEISPYSGGTPKLLPARVEGSYAREALKNGLNLEAQGQGNPFSFGFIGSSDTHTGAGSYDESNFFSKVGLLDATPTLRGSVPLGETDTVESGTRFATVATTIYTDAQGREYNSGKFPTWGASGLAGVWAEQNTREAIYDALRRKETFATSGPRIPVRFFAGAGLTEDMLDNADGVSRAYNNGVAMGCDLVGIEGAPAFLAWALRDADSAPLQRLQIIKGWLEADGATQEKVFDVACSDGLAVDPQTHRCPDNGARVDAESCAFSSDVGAQELKTLWRDPEFDPQQRAFYYVRVLENPTCRWSTWDALRAGVEPRDDLPRTIQERAWSSPIWYEPE